MALIIPEYGAVYVSTGETADPQPIDRFKVENTGNPPTGWDWLGSMSWETPFELEKVDSPDILDFDGEQENLCERPTFWRFSFAGLWGSQSMVSRAFGGKRYDSALGAWVVDKIRPAYKSVTVVFQDRDGTAKGFYMRRVKLRSEGSFSSDAEDFANFAMEGFVMKPDVDTWGKLLVFDK